MSELDYYGWYMDRLTGAGVLIVLGITLFGAGLTKGMQYLIVETSSETERDEVPPAESQETRAKKLVANMFVDLAGVLGKWSVVLAVITLGLYVSPLPAANPEAVPIFLALAAAMGLTGVLFVSVAALIHVRLLGNSAADAVSEITRAKT